MRGEHAQARTCRVVRKGMGPHLCHLQHHGVGAQAGKPGAEHVPLAAALQRTLVLGIGHSEDAQRGRPRPKCLRPPTSSVSLGGAAAVRACAACIAQTRHLPVLQGVPESCCLAGQGQSGPALSCRSGCCCAGLVQGQIRAVCVALRQHQSKSRGETLELARLNRSVPPHAHLGWLGDVRVSD